jgi:hypothetical protein
MHTPHSPAHPASPATGATEPVSQDHKPIHAERFKTKVCANYEKSGKCPYESRCMFAHGEHEMRSKDMNIRDNLVSEDAIRAFQKAATRRRKKAAKVARKRAAAAAKGTAGGVEARLISPFADTNADCDASDSDDSAEDECNISTSLNASRTQIHPACSFPPLLERLVEVLPLDKVRTYRHDPYSTSHVFAASTRSYSVCSNMPLPPPMPTSPHDSPLSTIRTDSAMSSALPTAQVTPAKCGRGAALSPIILPASTPSHGTVLTTYGRTTSGNHPTTAASATASPLHYPGTPEQFGSDARYCIGPMGCLLVKCRPMGVAQQILLP